MNRAQREAQAAKTRGLADGTWYGGTPEIPAEGPDRILATIRKSKLLVRCRAITQPQQRMFLELFDMPGPCVSGADIREQFHCSRASADQVAAAYNEWQDAAKRLRLFIP
jgi:hypothetical protein